MIEGFDPGVLESNFDILFTVGETFVLSIPPDKSVDIFMRVPSEEDINLARAYSLRESAKVREKIEKGECEEFDSSILDIVDELGKEELISLLIENNLDTIMSEARKDIQVPFPKVPEADAPNEEWERYQKEVDEWPSKFKEALSKKVEDLVEKYKLLYNNMEVEDLKKRLKASIINKFVEYVGISRYLDYILYRITFKDHVMKERIFDSPEKVRELPIVVRNQLKEFYSILNISTGTLKK